MSKKKKKKAKKHSTGASAPTTKKKSLGTKKPLEKTTKKKIATKKSVKKKATKKKTTHKHRLTEHRAPEETEKRDANCNPQQDVDIKSIEIPTLNEAITWCDQVTGITEECEVMPKNSEATVRQLIESIAMGGQQRPIVIAPDGRILDGRHRLLACCALGVKPKFEEKTAESPLAHVLADATQRDYNPAARASMALKTEEYIGKRCSEQKNDGKALRMMRNKFTEDQSIDIGSKDLLHVKAGETIREVAIRLAGATPAAVRDFTTLRNKDAALAEKAAQGEITLKEALRRCGSSTKRSDDHTRAKSDRNSKSSNAANASKSTDWSKQDAQGDRVLANGVEQRFKGNRSIIITPERECSGRSVFGLLLIDSEHVSFEPFEQRSEANDRAQEFLDD